MRAEITERCFHNICLKDISRRSLLIIEKKREIGNSE